MQDADFHALTLQVLWLAYAMMVTLGFVAHRTHFWTMGAIVDVLSFGSWTRACQVLLAMAVSLLGFSFLTGLGAINPTQTLYASAKWFGSLTPWVASCLVRAWSWRLVVAIKHSSGWARATSSPGWCFW